MSCACQANPCHCQEGPDPSCPPPKVTKCDLYRKGMKNVWVERGCNPGDEDAPGVCLLDTTTEDQVIYVIERDPKAREDLLKVTSDPELLKLAMTTPPLPLVEDSDREQALINRPNDPGSMPFYTQFRGQPPFAQ